MLGNPAPAWLARNPCTSPSTWAGMWDLSWTVQTKIKVDKSVDGVTCIFFHACGNLYNWDSFCLQVSYPVWRAPHAKWIKDIRKCLNAQISGPLASLSLPPSGHDHCFTWEACLSPLVLSCPRAEHPWQQCISSVDPPKKQLVLLGCCTRYSTEGWVENFVLWPYPPPLWAGRAQSYPFSAVSSPNWRVPAFPISPCKAAAPSPWLRLPFSVPPPAPLGPLLSLTHQSFPFTTWMNCAPFKSCRAIWLMWQSYAVQIRTVTQSWLIQFGDQELSLTRNILYINYSNNE